MGDMDQPVFDHRGSKACLIMSGACYAILIVMAYLSFGSILIHSGNEIESKSRQGTAFVKQMA